MHPDQAAWVREHVWTASMRRQFAELPGFYLMCACQHGGPCINAKDPGRHARCHVGRHPLPRYETYINTPSDYANFRQPYRYPTADATGWKFSTLAMVWLADRRCGWRCVCDCGHPCEDLAHAPDRNPMRPITYDRVPLFDLDLITT
ncbi:DUF6248 family natural product biosynthesis protein [Nonomuraea sp. NPDC049709]|uniref:DUF6248 family natural product biosynthesis protein n=1 Tax=Nonomuraea sp. NPDC049709 TaxID=3154736 RepID=UPI003447BA5E